MQFTTPREWVRYACVWANIQNISDWVSFSLRLKLKTLAVARKFRQRRRSMRQCRVRRCTIVSSELGRQCDVSELHESVFLDPFSGRTSVTDVIYIPVPWNVYAQNPQLGILFSVPWLGIRSFRHRSSRCFPISLDFFLFLGKPTWEKLNDNFNFLTHSTR